MNERTRSPVFAGVSTQVLSKRGSLEHLLWFMLSELALSDLGCIQCHLLQLYGAQHIGDGACEKLGAQASHLNLQASVEL